MKYVLYILLYLSFALGADAQAPHPNLVSMQCIGGNAEVGVNSPRITPTSDGGFILGISANSTYPSGNIDSFCTIGGERVVFLKYNQAGNVIQWSKCYESYADTDLWFLFPQADSGFVLGGVYSSGWGYFICKEDKLGNIVWKHGYSKDMGVLLHDMIQTTDGGYVMVGNAYYTDTNFTVHNSGSMNGDLCIIKLDSNGYKEWSKAIGGSEDDGTFNVTEAPNGGYYIAGTTQSSDYDCTGYHAGGGDAYLVRLDSRGNILWHRDLGGSGFDGYDGWCTSNGHGGVLFVTGSNSADGDVHHHIGYYDFWLVDLDSNNTILWDNCYGSPAFDDYPMGICLSSSGDIWITGETFIKGFEVDTSYGNGDGWVVHVDSVGNFIDAMVMGGSSYDFGEMIYGLTNDTILAGGEFGLNNDVFSFLPYYSSGGGGNVYLAKFAPSTTSIKNYQNNFGINLYPNPCSKNLNIDCSNRKSYAIKIIDIVGRLIYSGSMKDNVQLNVSEWVNGVYYMQLINNEGLKEVIPFVIEN